MDADILNGFSEDGFRVGQDAPPCLVDVDDRLVGVTGIREQPRRIPATGQAGDQGQCLIVEQYDATVTVLGVAQRQLGTLQIDVFPAGELQFTFAAPGQRQSLEDGCRRLVRFGIGGLNEGHLFPLAQGTGAGVVLLHLLDPVCWISRHQRPVQGAAVHGAEQGQETVATGRRQRFAAAA